MVLASCPVADRCAAVGDGDIDPNDLLFFTLTFSNLGNQPALGFRADIAVPGASALIGAASAAPRRSDLAARRQRHPHLRGGGDRRLRRPDRRGRDWHALERRSLHLRRQPHELRPTVEPARPTCALCFRPDIRLTSCPKIDICGGVSDGEVDPDDRLTWTLTFSNIGNAAASDFRASIVATAPRRLRGRRRRHARSIDLAPGATYEHTLVGDVTVLCGRTVDVDVVNLRSDAGTIPTSTRRRHATSTVVPPGPDCVGCPPVADVGSPPARTSTAAPGAATATSDPGEPGDGDGDAHQRRPEPGARLHRRHRGASARP